MRIPAEPERDRSVRADGIRPESYEAVLSGHGKSRNVRYRGPNDGQHEVIDRRLDEGTGRRIIRDEPKLRLVGQIHVLEDEGVPLH
jgi:hypothetical protein